MSHYAAGAITSEKTFAENVFIEPSFMDLELLSVSQQTPKLLKHSKLFNLKNHFFFVKERLTE